MNFIYSNWNVYDDNFGVSGDIIVVTGVRDRIKIEKLGIYCIGL